MTRLSLYLARLFAVDAIALFAVAVFLLFLIQCLRIFDVVSVKGQSVLTLLGQALLTMPSLAVVFLYVCVGIGLGRALRAMQSNHELHIIHSSRRLPALLGAVGIYTGACALMVLVVSNFVEPYTTRQFNDWSASVTADLVGRTLRPHRFAEVVPGVNMVIGGREGDGHLTNFFADDNRSGESRRTYIARSAIVAEDDEGYVLQLVDGAIQYMSDDFQFSQVAFARYDLALERLTGPTEYRNTLAEKNSFELLGEGFSTGTWSGEIGTLLVKRLGEALRVVAICIFVTALAAFPHGRRGRELPLELVVLGAAFLERGVASLPSIAERYGPLAGSSVLLVASAAVLLVRLRVFTPVWRRAPA
jgi:lipopolysaccharide export system permease protein